MFERNRSNKQGSPKKDESRTVPESPRLGTPTPPASTPAAVIGPGIEISGEVTATADLLVNGKIQGSIVRGAQSLEIGESGQVMAQVRAKLVKISGEVRGDIKGDEKVLISRTGRVLGNISAPRVQLDDGALFKGSIDMTPPEAAKPSAPSVEKTAASPAKPAAPATKSGSSASGPASPTAKRSEPERKEPSLTLKSG